MGRRINLLPVSERPRTTTNVPALTLVAGFIMVVFGLGLGYFLMTGALEDRRQELADLEQQTQLLETQAAALREYEELADRRVQAEEAVQALYAGRTLLADILDSISRVVPDTVWFETLEITAEEPGAQSAQAGGEQPQRDNRLSIEAKTYTVEDIAQFMVRLQLVPALSDVVLGRASAESGEGGAAGDIRVFSVEAALSNLQDPETPLPLSKVEVEGQ